MSDQFVCQKAKVLKKKKKKRKKRRKLRSEWDVSGSYSYTRVYLYQKLVKHIWQAWVVFGISAHNLHYVRIFTPRVRFQDLEASTWSVKQDLPRSACTSHLQNWVDLAAYMLSCKRSSIKAVQTQLCANMSDHIYHGTNSNTPCIVHLHFKKFSLIIWQHKNPFATGNYCFGRRRWSSFSWRGQR